MRQAQARRPPRARCQRRWQARLGTGIARPRPRAGTERDWRRRGRQAGIAEEREELTRSIIESRRSAEVL
jgi:hypothetical protein